MFLKTARVELETFPARSAYPFHLAIFREPAELSFRAPVSFFVGENGSGKTTLLEAIVRRCGIHIWEAPRRHAIHYNPTADSLWKYVRVDWADGPVPGGLFSAETFRNFADVLDDVTVSDPTRLEYFGGHLINTLSHGEGMLSYFRGRYKIRGLYFLDEPESALSPASQVKFLQMLHRFGADREAQFIIATHSPILLALPGAQIFNFGPERLEEISYEQSWHYRFYKQFLADPSAFLNGNSPSHLDV